MTGDDAGALLARPRPNRARRTAPSGLLPLNELGAPHAELYVPPGLDPAIPAPFVAILHGAGGVPRHALEIARAHADAFGAIVLAPASKASIWGLIAGRRFGPDVEALDALLDRVFEDRRRRPRRPRPPSSRRCAEARFRRPRRRRGSHSPRREARRSRRLARAGCGPRGLVWSGSIRRSPSAAPPPARSASERRHWSRARPAGRRAVRDRCGPGFRPPLRSEEPKRLGLKQAEFARLVGTDVPRRSLYENARRELRADYLARFADAEVEIVYVLTGRCSEGEWLSGGASELLGSYFALPPDLQALVDFAARLKEQFARGTPRTVHSRRDDWRAEE